MLLSVRRTAFLAGLIALALTGCSSQPPVIGTRGAVTVTGSVERMTDTQIAAAAEAWGRRYDADPKSRANILNYAAALRLNGQADQAVAVLEKGVVANQNDPELSAAYGKALAANGSFDQALRVIRSTQRPDRPDWKLYSAEGAILDQQGNATEARIAYQKALQIAPGEASILNNLALSYLLNGDIGNAEKTLKQAVSLPTATSRVRQNLALALGLQGKFKEADAIARQELDPAQAETNVAYLKSMLSQTNTWKEARKQG